MSKLWEYSVDKNSWNPCPYWASTMVYFFLIFTFWILEGQECDLRKMTKLGASPLIVASTKTLDSFLLFFMLHSPLESPPSSAFSNVILPPRPRIQGFLWLPRAHSSQPLHVPIAQVVLVVGTCLSMQETEETWLQSLGWEDPLEKETATHSSTLARGIPWTEEPGGLQSIVSLRVGHDWSDLAHMYPEFYSYISTVNHLLVQATV